MSLSTIPATNLASGLHPGMFGDPDALPYSGGANVSTTRGLLPSESVTFQVIDVAEFTSPTTIGEVESWGWLEIPGATLRMPKQRFLCSFSDRHLTFESQPSSPWPKITIEVVADSSTNGWRVQCFRVRPSQETTDAQIFYSRVQYLLSELGHCLIHIDELKERMAFSFHPFSGDAKQQLLYRAAIFRKLSFIEKALQCTFSWPREISPEHLTDLDLIFRGMTEGKFTTRSSDITLPLMPTEVDLSKPPFEGPGEFNYRYADEFHELFGRRISMGSVLIHLDQVEIASPKALRQLKAGQAAPVWTRFSLLDHQIHLSFERKMGQTQKQIRRRLELFKHELAKEDPPELVALLDKPLISDVSAREADLIAMGWMQYNRLPDRYCPQEPVLNSSANAWRVPIWLGYPNGQGGEVGELLIDVKSGKVVSHTPLEEVRSRGKSLARELLHAS